METTATKIREAILDNKGLRLEKIARNKTIVTNKSLLPDDCNGTKSNLMLYIEKLHRDKIESIIWSDTVEHLVTRLEIGAGTISRWRRKFPKDGLKNE